MTLLGLPHSQCSLQDCIGSRSSLIVPTYRYYCSSTLRPCNYTSMPRTQSTTPNPPNSTSNYHPPWFPDCDPKAHLQGLSQATATCLVPSSLLLLLGCTTIKQLSQAARQRGGLLLLLCVQEVDQQAAQLQAVAQHCPVSTVRVS